MREHIALKDYTVFRIGGPARYFAQAGSRAEVGRLLRWARESALPVFILGAGSNVLIADRGFHGLVIKADLYHCGVKGHTAIAEAGVGLAQLVNTALRKGLCGMEWAVGIPGTVGGAVRGNAGCFGGEIKDVLVSVEVVDAASEELFTLTNAQCKFHYRHSIFKERPSWLILEALFALEPGPAADGYALVREYSARRLETQDIGQRCAGCMFKNVLWVRRDIHKPTVLERFPDLRQFSQSYAIPAGYLIDAIGMKGFRIGEIAVSAKHGNYIVNLGNGTAEQALMLISALKERVRRAYDIQLEEEVQLVGFGVSN